MAVTVIPDTEVLVILELARFCNGDGVCPIDSAASMTLMGFHLTRYPQTCVKWLPLMINVGCPFRPTIVDMMAFCKACNVNKMINGIARKILIIPPKSDEPIYFRDYVLMLRKEGVPKINPMTS